MLNKFAGRCEACGVKVEAGRGVYERGTVCALDAFGLMDGSPALARAVAQGLTKPRPPKPVSFAVGQRAGVRSDRFEGAYSLTFTIDTIADGHLYGKDAEGRNTSGRAAACDNLTTGEKLGAWK